MAAQKGDSEGIRTGERKRPRAVRENDGDHDIIVDHRGCELAHNCPVSVFQFT